MIKCETFTLEGLTKEGLTVRSTQAFEEVCSFEEYQVKAWFGSFN